MRKLKRLVLLCVVALMVTGCPGGSRPEETIELPLLIGVSIRPESTQRELVDGRWTSATEIRFSAVDAERLSVPERTVLDSGPDSAQASPRLSIELETGVTEIVEPQALNPDFCFEDDVMLVDPTQGSEHVVVAAGECINGRTFFEFAADIDPKS